MIKQFDLEPLSIPGQEILEYKTCRLILSDKHIQFQSEFLADDSDDELLRPDENIHYWNTIALKSSVVGCEILRMTDCKLYKVTIILHGFNNDIYFYKRTKNEAILIQGEIRDYILN